VAAVVALGLSLTQADAKPRTKAGASKKSKSKVKAEEVELVEDPPPAPKSKKGSEKKPPPEPDSPDVVMTTTAADGTKFEVVELEEDESLAAPAPKEPEEDPSAAKRNWVSLSLQQDTLVFTSTGGVCKSVDANGVRKPGNDQYSCRDDDGVYSAPVYAAGGNQVNGGLGIATTRIIVGYDRLFIHRVRAGARVGYAFRQAPSAEGVQSSLPLHLEARGAFYLLGQRPFESPGIRPFVSLGLGVGQVDSVVAVDFYRDQAAVTAKDKDRLHAWRRTGMGFIAPGGGASYAIKNLMINAELRFTILFPAVGIAPALNIGASYGF
jgi:hypothetical protein